MKNDYGAYTKFGNFLQVLITYKYAKDRKLKAYGLFYIPLRSLIYEVDNSQRRFA